MAQEAPASPRKMARHGRLRITVYRGLAGLDALADSWRALVSRLERPAYVHFWEWHRSYLEAGVHDPDRVIFCAVFAGQQAVAILPLVRADKRLCGLHLRLLALPLDPLTLHADIIVDPRVQAEFELMPILQALRGDLGEPWDVVRLGLVLEDSIANAVVGGLQGGLRGAMIESEQLDVSNALEIAPYDEMLARFSKNLRSSLRNSRNKLAKLESVTLHQARTPDELEAAFPLLLSVEASGWKGKAGTAISSKPQSHDMYEGFVRQFGAIGRCRIDLLMHGERPMAGQLSLAVGDRLYAFKIGYDESYSQEAPGRMLLEQVLRSLSAEPGIRFLDLISNQAWHHGWRAIQRPVHMHYLCRTGPMGVLFWLFAYARRLWRGMLRS